jgi:predicted DNA-binding protein
MSALSLRLPDSLHNRARVLSKRDRVSINQFIASAVAEKISALETEDYLNERAKRASRKKFEIALSKIPDREPDEYDKY